MRICKCSRTHRQLSQPPHYRIKAQYLAAILILSIELVFASAAFFGSPDSFCSQRCSSRKLEDLPADTGCSATVSRDESTDEMLSGVRRMTADAVKKTKMYVSSKNGDILNWADLRPDESCSTVADMCDDGIHPSPLDATSLLKLLPRGAYTTCRTIGRGTSVYQFDYHAERLASSSASMIAEGVLPENCMKLDTGVYAKVTNAEKVRAETLSCIKKTVAEFRKQYQERMYPCDEMKITLLQTWLPQDGVVLNGVLPADNGIASMYCHVGILPKRRDGEYIKCEVHGHGRSNAAAKDSKWVSEREDRADYHCEECILVNDNAEMLEGTQTNFFLVLKDGCVLTADEGILRGSVRDSVLRVCAQHGIPLHLRPPTVHDLETASGAFLSSTSRLVLPIHEVVVKVSKDDVKGTPPKSGTYHFPNCQTTKSIQELVLEDVKSHCVSIV